MTQAFRPVELHAGRLYIPEARLIQQASKRFSSWSQQGEEEEVGSAVIVAAVETAASVAASSRQQVVAARFAETGAAAVGRWRASEPTAAMEAPFQQRQPASLASVGVVTTTTTTTTGPPEQAYHQDDPQQQAPTRSRQRKAGACTGGASQVNQEQLAAGAPSGAGASTSSMAYQQKHALHRLKRLKKRAPHRDLVISFVPRLRTSIINRLDFFHRYSKQEQEVLSCFDFLDELIVNFCDGGVCESTSPRNSQKLYQSMIYQLI